MRAKRLECVQLAGAFESAGLTCEKNPDTVMPEKIGFVGVGRMGANMARRRATSAPPAKPGKSNRSSTW